MTCDQRSAYHIKNDRYIAYLQRKSIEAGATTVEGEVGSITRHENGDVASLTFPVLHLARDLMWIAAIAVWTKRRVTGEASHPSHSMHARVHSG
jgi:hypothetical protein